MSQDGNPNDAPAGRAALREWVAYLEEIGVRDLQAPAPAAVATERHVAAPPTRSRPPAASTPPVEKFAPPVSGAEKKALLPIVDGFDSPPPDDPARRLQEIREELGECTRCRLHEGRANVVFGVGSPRAGLMFIGEGPGADEDAQGEPFVGRAGKKLDQMIGSIKLRREDVYIANIVKCRPPKNRNPEKDEVATCSPFLFAQIEAIRPRVIVTLGAPAARTLLETKIGITKLRGNWHSFRGIPVMPTFHPAYLLRVYTHDNRAKVYADLLAARARLDAAP